MKESIYGIYKNDTSYKQILARKDAFLREDESDDTVFYSRERFVEHLDKTALETVEKLIGGLIVEKNPAILDLMASIDSHIPASVRPSELTGLGLNEKELNANSDLNGYVLHDLNKNPSLPFENERFDIVINTVSVQYMRHPGKVFAEVARVLKPGGLYLVIFSNRSFITKSIRAWELCTMDERIKMVTDFFDQTGIFEKPEVFMSMGKPRPSDDKYASTGQPSDPVFAVYADKSGARSKNIRRPVPEEHRHNYDSEEIEVRKGKIKHTGQCPYCGEKLHIWGITDNPMTTWDHDLYICTNDSCPYIINGWRVMYEQGNHGFTYRFCYDPKSDSVCPIPVPSLAVIKDSLRD